MHTQDGRSARGLAEYEESAVEEEVDELVLEEQVGVLKGALAFDSIHSDDLWRHIWSSCSLRR